MDLPDIDTNPLEKLTPTQDLMVLGEKKDWNEIEEFWMQKLTKIEEQYDTHMVSLERALLENRVHRRVLSRQDNQLSTLKKQFKEKAKAAEGFQKKTVALQNDLSKQENEGKKLEAKLAVAVSKFMNVDSTAKDQRTELRRCNRDILTLRKKLQQLEKEKKLLSHDLQVKENDHVRYREKDTDLSKSKTTLLKNLKSLDTERQVQTVANLKLSQNIGNVLESAALRDRRILLLRRELESVHQENKKQRAEYNEVIHRKQTVEQKLCDAKEKVQQSNIKLDDLSSHVLSWQKEMEYKEIAQVKENLELKKVKTENRRLRSQVADLRQNLGKVQDDLKSLSTQRDRMQVELRKMKSQEIAIQNLMRQNAFQKLKITSRIPQLPKIKEGMMGTLTTTEETTNVNKMNMLSTDFRRHCPVKEIQTYTKQIWDLERKLQNVQRKIDDGKRKENTYTVRLQRFSELQEQLFWTQKAMRRLEADRQGMERMIQSFSKIMPRKIPFEKIVTDPSILDRLAKQRVLQQRLASQTAKVEQLKEITTRLLQKEERRRAEGLGGPRQEESLQPWQLNYWKQRSEFPVDTSNPNDANNKTSMGYYKDYMGFLGQEIPRLKSVITDLERKKQCLRSLRTAASSQSRSASVSIVDLTKVESQNVDDEEDEDEEEEEEDLEDLEEEQEDIGSV